MGKRLVNIVAPEAWNVRKESDNYGRPQMVYYAGMSPRNRVTLPRVKGFYE